MLYFAPWKKIAILLTVVAGVLFAMPNLLSPSARDAAPDWLPSDTVKLGLDLQGGAHVLVEAEMEPVFEQKMETLAVDLRDALKEAGVTRRGTPQVSTDAVTVRIPLPEETEIARAALEGLAQPLESGAITGVNSTDLEVTYDAPEQTFRLAMTPGAKAETTERVILQSLEVVRRRIDPEGVREPTVARQGEDRILIQVPGADSAREILDLLDDPAVLGFHTVNMELGQEDIARGRTRPGFKALPELENPERLMLVSRTPLITGDQVVSASSGFDQNNEPAVNFRFNAAAGKKFADFTRDNVGELFAIVVDDKIVSAPVVREIIPGGAGQITGNFTVEEATKLSVQISSGALPAKLTPLESRTVGPELGADSIAAGEIACIVGFIAVMIFMVVVYGRFGVFADIALLVNLVLLFGALSMLGATLTLPGIAGIVLTVGMAVDANVLVFERIREELENGRKPARAIETGYERALSAILDANVTTLIAALILYALGSGPVRGFAVTLGIGIVTSVFTAVMVTRLMVAQWYDWKRPKQLKITLLELVRNGTRVRFMRLRMVAAAFSAAMVAGSIALFAMNGLNYGIDFRGGTLIEARTDGPADLGAIRQIVGDMDLGDVAVQAFGKPEDVLIRVEEIKGGDEARTTLVDKVDAALSAEFSAFEIRRVETVGPKVSGELVQAGIMAVLLAISAVLIYIWLRFEWQFSVGAVTALAHDVALTIGVFALLGLEFNLSIIAAILTIVGYSLNDTVVVYDRLRENLRKYKSKPLEDVIDLSLNETLSRTLMTSITTLLALLALYFLGGAVMQGFTFAMIWGVLIGTYSSVFVAAPILIKLGVKRDWSKPEAQATPGGVQFGSSDAP